MKVICPVIMHTGAYMGNHDIDLTQEMLDAVPQHFIEFYCETLQITKVT